MLLLLRALLIYYITSAGVEMFKKSMPDGMAGDNVGVLLRGVKREDVLRGQVLAKPGSVKTYTKFAAEVYVLTKEEGGRHTPFFNNYRYVLTFVSLNGCCRRCKHDVVIFACVSDAASCQSALGMRINTIGISLADRIDDEE